MGLYELKRSNGCEIVALLTAVTRHYDRVSIHGVRRTLLEQQAASLGIPLEKVYISKNSSDEEYETNMQTASERYRAVDVASVAFGHVFLEDLRKYREDHLVRTRMKALFPLWNRNTTELAHAFIDAGFKAVVTCVDAHVLDSSFVGKSFDGEFLERLPAHVNPSGENGEFHCFVFDGPIFQREIAYVKGEDVLRDGRFWYCDLIPRERAFSNHHAGLERRNNGE